MLVIGPRPKYFPFCGDLCSPPGSSLPSHYSSSISLTFFTWKPGSNTSAEFLSLKKPLTHHWSLPFPFYLRLVFYLLSLQNHASTVCKLTRQKCSLQKLLFQSSAILNIVSVCRFSSGCVSIRISLVSANYKYCDACFCTLSCNWPPHSHVHIQKLLCYQLHLLFPF